jgi:subtilisin family serine protease
MRPSSPARAAIGAVCALAACAPAARAADAPAGSFVPGEALVRFAPSLHGAEVRSRLAGADARVEHALPAVPGLRLVDLPHGTSVGEAVNSYADMPGVLYAEPNYRRELFAVPNDPLFEQQWSLRNTGQSAFGVRGVAGADERATGAWDRQTGNTGVTIAVVDTGAALQHPDLAPNIWTNPGEIPGNGFDDDLNGFIDDVHGWDFAGGDADPNDAIDTDEGHGTHVAGVIGAVGSNGIGTAGVDWRASVMPLRVPLTVDGELGAFQYARDNGARIVNYSAGQQLPSASEKAAIDAAPNVLFVVAAGNDTSNNDAAPVYPCAYPSANVICVGSSNQADGLSGFSNFGPASVDLVAPGENILSTWPAGGITDVLADSFGQKPLSARWKGGGPGRPWHLTERLHKGLTAADSAKGRYDPGTNSWIRSRPIDVSAWRSCVLGYFFKVKTDSGRDRLIVEVSKNRKRYFRVASYAHKQRGLRFKYVPKKVGGARKLYIRFRLRTDGSGRADGAYVDNVDLSCQATRDTWAFASGTSFSAPQVAGAAGLVLAEHPADTTADLKAALLGTVDPLPGLAGKVVTGGRLDVAAALGP